MSKVDEAIQKILSFEIGVDDDDEIARDLREDGYSNEEINLIISGFRNRLKLIQELTDDDLNLIWDAIDDHIDGIATTLHHPDLMTDGENQKDYEDIIAQGRAIQEKIRR